MNAQLSEQYDSYPSFASGGYDITDVIRAGGSSANLAVAGALLVALLVVTLGPAERSTGRGRLVLRSVVGVGLVTAGLAATSAVLTVTDDPEGPTFSVAPTAGFLGEGTIARLAGTTPLLVAAALAGYVAWCAFSALGDASGSPD